MDLRENITYLILAEPIKYKNYATGFCFLCPENRQAKAIYGNYPNLPLLCYDHRNNLADVTVKKCLFVDSKNQQCEETAIYGFYHKEAIYCRHHKNDKMIDVISRFEEKDIFKFVSGLDFLENRKIIANTSLSSILKTSKSRFRPDVFILSQNNVIIVEVDEKQHKTYDKEKEIIRENTIRSLIEKELKLPVIFIRLNSSVFYDKNGKIILFPLASRFKLLEKVLLENRDKTENIRITICFDGSEDQNYIS